MQKCIDSFPSGQTNLELYAHMLLEWTKLFKHLGKGMVMAFQGKWNLTFHQIFTIDIVAKANTILENK